MIIFAKFNKITPKAVFITSSIAYLLFFIFIKNFSVIGASNISKNEEYLYFTLTSRLNFNNSKIFCGNEPDIAGTRYYPEKYNPIIGELINEKTGEIISEASENPDDRASAYSLTRTQHIRIDLNGVEAGIKIIYCKVGKMNFAFYYPDSNEIIVNIPK